MFIVQFLRMRVLTTWTLAKVSRPSNTSSTFGHFSWSSVTSRWDLNAHSLSPIPEQNPRGQIAGQDLMDGRHKHCTSHSWRPTNLGNFVPVSATKYRHTDCHDMQKLTTRTGSGILLSRRSSTWTVVGNSDTSSHSPSLVPFPPPTCVKDHWVNKGDMFIIFRNRVQAMVQDESPGACLSVDCRLPVRARERRCFSRPKRAIT